MAGVAKRLTGSRKSASAAGARRLAPEIAPVGELLGGKGIRKIALALSGGEITIQEALARLDAARCYVTDEWDLKVLIESCFAYIDMAHFAYDVHVKNERERERELREARAALSTTEARVVEIEHQVDAARSELARLQHENEVLRSVLVPAAAEGDEGGAGSKRSAPYRHFVATGIRRAKPREVIVSAEPPKRASGWR